MGLIAKTHRRSAVVLFLLCALGVAAIQSGSAGFVHAQSATFTLAGGGAFLRIEPRLTSPLGAPVFEGQTYAITARTPDQTWLKLDAKSGVGWVLASLGTVGGEVSMIPAQATAPHKLPTVRPKSSPYLSPITAKAKQVWQQAVKAGRRADLFTVVGDCNSEPDAYLWRLSAGTFDVSKQPEFHRVTEQFMWSFTRGSGAAFSGFNSASMFDPQWANPALCQKDEGPLACETRRSNASIAFVALGTGDQFTWQTFEANYRRILDYLLANKVLPVLVTKADDLENQQGGAKPGHINDTIRALGKEYGLPVMDFHAATRALPDFGMRWEGNENFHMNAAGSDMRILLTLHTLAALTSK